MPVPCHPDCLAMAYALKLGGKVVPLTQLLDPTTLLEMQGNTILHEQDPELRRLVVELFSTSHSPDSSAWTLRQLLCCLPELAVPPQLTYDKIFRVLIVQFLDPYNFDVRSVKKSCIHIVHPDGRIIPFDTYNLFYRDTAAGRMPAAAGASRCRSWPEGCHERGAARAELLGLRRDERLRVVGVLAVPAPGLARASARRAAADSPRESGPV